MLVDKGVTIWLKTHFHCSIRCKVQNVLAFSSWWAPQTPQNAITTQQASCRTAPIQAPHWRRVSARAPPHLICMEPDFQAGEICPPDDKLEKLRLLLAHWERRKAGKRHLLLVICTMHVCQGRHLIGVML